MRLRNKKNAHNVVNESDYIINNPKEQKGNWKNIFDNNNDIHIEIGMGKGNFITQMAINNPNINYVGIEMYDSVIVTAVKNLAEREEKIHNLKLIRMDATNIEEVFEKEISRIYLNFSDPWPKAKHAKRRLTSKEFLTRYDNIFKSNKVIIQKTDNNDLFEFSMESLIEHGYVLKNVTRDLYNNMIEGNVATEYETKFSQQGIKINRLEAYKD
ncbi:MAG: tRNA (guanosine(46)-N7)-methyltransferase TrmB [Clostridia bacterium]|nr:tRNA (guanosine(46)-N7)-methyltransferase TrmB [Clostridia bacterium]